MQRVFAALIAITALASLFAQYLVSDTLMGAPGWGAVLWRMAGYFTVLTNALVAVTFVLLLLRPTNVTAAWGAGLTLWISAVGAVYHVLLAGLWQPVGLAWWADQGLHSAVPVLVLIWWLSLADKAALRFHHALLWLLWPASYCAYALIRGGVSGFYPYPFVDVATLGTGQVAINIAALTLAFAAGGLALVALSRKFFSRQPN
jgi:hypothetical protein